jgi:hypothetical protein
MPLVILQYLYSLQIKGDSQKKIRTNVNLTRTRNYAVTHSVNLYHIKHMKLQVTMATVKSSSGASVDVPANYLQLVRRSRHKQTHSEENTHFLNTVLTGPRF